VQIASCFSSTRGAQAEDSRNCRGSSTLFKPWMQALRDIGYSRFVNPFMHGHVEPDDMAAALGKSRDHLKRLV
jgi:hypothetical protein